MRQPIKGEDKKPKTIIPSRRKVVKKYGTSKLETFFAHEYLDRLGLKYIYEYNAKDIGRFFDFAVTIYDYDYIMETKNDIVGVRQEKQIVPIAFMIEIDGDWYHGNKEVLGEKKLNKMQLRNKVVDAIKDKWCAMHHIPILRLWENDVRKNPKKVFDELNKFIDEAKQKRMIIETKQKPH